MRTVGINKTWLKVEKYNVVGRYLAIVKHEHLIRRIELLIYARHGSNHFLFICILLEPHDKYIM